MEKRKELKMNYAFAGSHILSDFYDMEGTVEAEGLLNAIREACMRNDLSVLDVGRHEFENGGFTLFLLLAESHISVHFYIETRTAFVDVFTCGQNDPLPVLNEIRQYCIPTKETTQRIERGVQDVPR